MGLLHFSRRALRSVPRYVWSQRLDGAECRNGVAAGCTIPQRAAGAANEILPLACSTLAANDARAARAHPGNRAPTADMANGTRACRSLNGAAYGLSAMRSRCCSSWRLTFWQRQACTRRCFDRRSAERARPGQARRRVGRGDRLAAGGAVKPNGHDSLLSRIASGTG